MYQGIKRDKAKLKREVIKMPTKIQLLKEEDIESNGYIISSYKFDTWNIIADENLKFKDFEITNLQKAGIDPTTLPKTILSANVDDLERRARAAEQEIDKFELIAEIEREENEQHNEQHNETQGAQY